MSEYSSLKATINANVKVNNNQEINGAVMNSVLNAMVTSLGAGYQFIGVATPTNPGSAQTPDYKCFYLATTPGTYTNLGGLVVADGEVAILKFDTSWTKVSGIASNATIVIPTGNIRIERYGYRLGSLSDMNDAEDNRYYMIQVDELGKSTIANLPDDMPADGYAWYAITLSFKTRNNRDSKIQFLFKNNLSYIFRRQEESSTWYPWSRVDKSSLLDELSANATIVIPTGNIRVQSHRLGSLSDMNDAEDNRYYMIQMDYSGKSTIANLPDDMPADGYAWYAITLSFKSTYNRDSKVQFLFKNDLSYIFRRQKENSTWYPWGRILDTPSLRKKIVVASDGSGNYIKFTDALAYAYSIGNVDIIVKNGTYDITDEIDIEKAGSGPTIGNGTHIYCESNVNIVCEYTGSDSTTKSNFSVLNAGEGDYEIHDINIKCKNIRYCVHDERGTSPAPYHHKYINCHMVLDNTENSWDSPQCIGGGLGCYGIIEVDGGYYEGLPHVGENRYGEISYHNTSASTSKSKITIKNVYFANNTFRAGYYGSSTDVTDCFVNGCSMLAQPLVRAETGSSTVINMRLYAWGNEIRNGQ